MQFLVGWLLLYVLVLAAPERAVGHASGECQGKTCATPEDAAADEAGLLQVKSPAQSGNNAFLDIEMEGQDAPEELVRKMALMHETGDAAPTYKALPKGVKGPLDSLGASLLQNTDDGDATDKLVGVCDFTKKTDCPVARMKAGFSGITPNKKTWKTACMNSSSPFMFQVYPGDKDKLMIFFQDGGACWDPLSVSLGLCSKQPWVIDTSGIFNRSEPTNPYKHFTIVHINYCSGDAHAGNAVHNWGGTWYVQAGYNNSIAAIEWAKQNVAARLTHLSIMGSSAGALGTQFWARTLLNDFKSGGRSYASASVLVDSYLGIFPQNTQGVVIGQIFRTCDLPLGKGWSKPCGGALTVQDVFSETMGMFPDVAFAVINSKGDQVQGQFYMAIGVTIAKKIMALSPEMEYHVVTSILHRYNAAPNFVAFQVDGTQHVFTSKARCEGNVTACSGDVYDAKSSGPLALLTGTGNAAGDVLLIDWLDELVNKKSILQSRCYGASSEFSEFKPFSPSLCDMKMQGKHLRLRSSRR